jgi:hypothetical protein
LGLALYYRGEVDVGVAAACRKRPVFAGDFAMSTP